MKSYSGKYKVKNPEKYSGDFTNVVYRSSWERACFHWCDNSDDIIKWSSEETIVPYLYEVDNKIHRYFVDLKITYKDGKTKLIEVKPNKHTKAPVKRSSKKYLNEALVWIKNNNKWKAAEKFAKQRGWVFEIWTEIELKKMGILKKNKKPLKPLRRMKKKHKTYK